MTPPLQYYLIDAALLFVIGFFGLLVRRNILLTLLSIELILNSANLSFVAFSSFLGNLTGQVMVFFTMIIAAAEITVALAVVVLLYRKKGSTNTEDVSSLKW